MSETQYVVLCAQAIGGGGNPVTIEYGFDGKYFDDRSAAIKHGFKVRGSDDFNIGVLHEGNLISLDWMDEPGDTDIDLLQSIQDETLNL